ncbi:MAG: tetratricopeptide repeat protein, partial [Kofleriaceae bacterium]
MIEATCSACGTLNRVAESDVPAGTKFVNCSSCMSKVALPGKPTSTGPLPIKPPAGMLPKVAPPLKPPAVPKPPPVPSRVTPVAGSPIAPKPPATPAIPAIAAPPPAPVAPAAPAFDLADLPAPKRASPLGAEVSKPAPKSGLASALDADPRGAKRGGGVLDLDALSGGADLPAPKSPSGGRAPSPLADAPVPVPGGSSIVDLPAPKSADPPDLPAPRGPGPVGIIDLPAPKGPGPAPGPESLNSLFDDLTLTPKKSKPAERGDDGLAPKGFFDDLPAPAAAKAKPAERPSEDIAPKGFFDDLPTSKAPPVAARSKPAERASDEVAPKGFFDDLPQPAAKLGKPQPTSDEVAPKGFFDDLPQPAAKLGKPQPTSDEVAPKGFFDDLPQPSSSAKSEPARAAAPQGFFEQLPQPRAKSSPAAPEPSTTMDLASELPSLELESSTVSIGDSPPRPDEPALPPSMGLAQPAGSAKPSESFDDLDLSKPSGSPVRFDPPKQKSATAAPAKPMRSLASAKPGDAPSLEVEGGASAAELAARPAEKPDLKAKQEERAKAKADAEAAKNARRKQIKIVSIATAGVLALGAGGFVFYQRHAAAEERAAQISLKLHDARKQMTDPDTWSRAASSANDVVGLDASNAEALGIAAEASFATGLSNGKGADARFAKGRTLITDALKVGAGGQALLRAQALSSIAANQPAQAVPKLGELIKQSPTDGTLDLYLGWAHAAAGDQAAAIKAFDQAATKSPAIKSLAMLERARAKLALGDIAGASADFTAVLAAEPENIAAMVGLASTLPRSQSQQQESDLLAILARKDIASADPRVVAQAWSLTGELARLSSRLDVARERNRKSLEAMPNDHAATTRMAEVELSAGKLDAATKLLSTV